MPDPTSANALADGRHRGLQPCAVFDNTHNRNQYSAFSRGAARRWPAAAQPGPALGSCQKWVVISRPLFHLAEPLGSGMK